MSGLETESKKTCPGCGQSKPITDFPKNDAMIGGRGLTCHSCTADLAKAAPNAAISGYYSEGSPLYRAYRDPELRDCFAGQGVNVGEIAACLLEPESVQVYAEGTPAVDGINRLLGDEAVRREVSGKSLEEVAELIVHGSPADHAAAQASAARAQAARQYGEGAPAGDVARYAEALEREQAERRYAEQLAERHREELSEYASAEQIWGAFANSLGISPLAVQSPAPPRPPTPEGLKTYAEQEQRERDEQRALDELEKKKAEEAEAAWPEVERWLVQ